MSPDARMEIIEDEAGQALATMGSLGRITLSYQCANDDCGELLPVTDHRDGLVEITARCPACGAMNGLRLA